MKSNNGTQYFQQDRVYSMGDVALCLPATLIGGSYLYLEVKKIEDNWKDGQFTHKRICV